MKIIKPSVEIQKLFTTEQILHNLARYGRFSTKSESTKSSADFVRERIKQGHESVIEHVSITALVVTDRGVLTDVTRHRIASYTAESTRFCNYGKERFGSEITVINPCSIEEESAAWYAWFGLNEMSERTYMHMLEMGCTTDQARQVLTNSLKTSFAMTMNLREWRHFFKLRCAKDAHPHVQQIANMALDEMYEYIPPVFEDIYQEFRT